MSLFRVCRLWEIVFKVIGNYRNICFLVSDTVNREPVVNLLICCLRVFLAHLAKGQVSIFVLLYVRHYILIFSCKTAQPNETKLLHVLG